MILCQTIWGALEKNIRLAFRKSCVNPDRFALLLIKQKNYNKIFGEIEFEYFGGSDGANKLYGSRGQGQQLPSEPPLPTATSGYAKIIKVHKL